jgi:hypothetical protein
VKVKAVKWVDGWHAYPMSVSFGQLCYIVPKAEHERSVATRNAARALCEHASCITNAIRGRKGCKEALAALDALVTATEGASPH